MTNEEQGERYFMTISSGMVEIRETVSRETTGIFTGPERLLAATAELNRLNATEETSLEGEATWKPWTPAEFLSKKLPAVARRQRIEGHLTEVKEIEESLVRVLAEDAANLQRATALREKLEKELETGLSSTETAQNGSGVPADLHWPFNALAASQAVKRGQSKPGPY